MVDLDRGLYKWINNLADHSAWAHVVVRSYAQDGIALFALLLVVGWWIARTSPEPVIGASQAAWAAVGPVIALGVNQIVGAAVARARPYATIPHMHLLVASTKDFSFASDHATVAGGVAAGLLLLDRRLGRVALGAAACMAFARVYVGAHYPGDVIAGLALGAAITIALARPGHRLLRATIGRLSTTALQPLIMRKP